MGNDLTKNFVLDTFNEVIIGAGVPASTPFDPDELAKYEFGIGLADEFIGALYAYANAKDGHFAPYVQMCLISQCDDWYAEHPES